MPFFIHFFRHHLLGLPGSALGIQAFSFLLEGSKTAIDVGIGSWLLLLWMRLCDDTPITIASILSSFLFGLVWFPPVEGELELHLYIRHSLQTLYDE
jgi:hypothetical protein